MEDQILVVQLLLCIQRSKWSVAAELWLSGTQHLEKNAVATGSTNFFDTRRVFYHYNGLTCSFDERKEAAHSFSAYKEKCKFSGE